MKEIIESLRKFLKGKDYTDFPKVDKSKDETLRFLSRIEKSKLESRLSKDEKFVLSKNLSLLKEEFENFEDRKSETSYQIINFRLFDSYDLILSKFDKFSEGFTNKVLDLSKLVNEIEGKVDSLESDYSKKSLEIDSTLTKAKDTKSKLESYIKRATLETKKFVSDMQASNRKEIDNQFKEISGSLDGIKKDWNDKFKDLDEKRIRFSELFELAEKYYAKDRFNEYSKEEEGHANTYRQWSIYLMITVVTLAIGLTVVSFFTNDLKSNAIDYVMRILLVFTLMIPAIYTSRESSRHRKNADKYMQMGNELTAFEVTLGLEGNDLPTEIKNQIKLEIYKRYFGNILIHEDQDIGDTVSSFLSKFSNGSKNK